METPQKANPDAWPRYIGAFAEGDELDHGGVVINKPRHDHLRQLFRDRLAFFGNPKVVVHLGMHDPGHPEKHRLTGLAVSILACPLIIFQFVFGLSVHLVSSQGMFNKRYANLRQLAHVFIGDIIYATSTVLGLEFTKDDATTGSVQVDTRARNSRGMRVFEYVRQVICFGKKDVKFAKSSSIKPMPDKADLSDAVLPPKLHRLGPEIMGCEPGLLYNDLEVGRTYQLPDRLQIPLAVAARLMIPTANDADTHTTPPFFVVYGGCVKYAGEGMVSGLIPYGWPIAMNSGDHVRPTYACDMIPRMFPGNPEDRHEELRTEVTVTHKEAIPGRDDCGLVTLQINVFKLVTEAGLRALEAHKNDGVKEMFMAGDDRVLKVGTFEEVWAVPTHEALAKAA